MESKEFDEILEQVVAKVHAVLGSKASEYATDEDRLFNFKTAARLQNMGIPQALGGMMAKHTVSVYDMIETGKEYPIEKWDEKIIDHINYLILLRACLIENAKPDKD